MDLTMALVPSGNQFAETASAIANLLKVIVWPCLILFLSFRYHDEVLAILKELPRLIRRLKSGQIGPLKGRFDELPPETVWGLTLPLSEAVGSLGHPNVANSPLPIEKSGRHGSAIDSEVSVQGPVSTERNERIIQFVRRRNALKDRTKADDPKQE